MKTGLGWVLLCSDFVISNHRRRETPRLVGQLIVIGPSNGTFTDVITYLYSLLWTWNDTIMQ